VAADSEADRLRARLDFLAREYDTIRAEHLASRSAQQTVATAALASAAVVFAALLTVWKNTNLRIGILSFAPIFLAALWGMWFGEVLRIARTSSFLSELEDIINKQLRDRAGRPDRAGQDHRTDLDSPSAPHRNKKKYPGLDAASPLHWEGWMRGANEWGKPVRARMSYILTSVTLLGTGLVSTVLSLVFSFTLPNITVGVEVMACGAAAAWLAMFGYAIVSLWNPVIVRSWKPQPRTSQQPGRWKVPMLAIRARHK